MTITINKRHTVEFESGVKVYVRGLSASEYYDFLKTVKIPILPQKPPFSADKTPLPSVVAADTEKRVSDAKDAVESDNSETETIGDAEKLGDAIATAAKDAAATADNKPPQYITAAELPNKLSTDTVKACLVGVIGGDGFLYAEYDDDGNEFTVPVPLSEITGDWLIENTNSSLVDSVLAKIIELTNLSEVQKKISQSP